VESSVFFSIRGASRAGHDVVLANLPIRSFMAYAANGLNLGIRDRDCASSVLLCLFQYIW